MTYLQQAQKTFPLSIEAPRSARRWVHASGIVPLELIDKVDLVVSELGTNSVTHSGLAEPNVVSVRLVSLPEGVTGEIVDHGRGIGATPARDERSMGLRIVERTAYRWGYTDDPTRVWFEFRDAEERPSRLPVA